ncbi:MAG: zinc-dependent metalloprotease [Prevotellaceae bacterium]|nr:zinc-dependent metalloprotease [Prevotellaceae bacterium]
MRKFNSFLIFFLIFGLSFANAADNKAKKTSKKKKPKTETAAPAEKKPAASEIKPYSEIITKDAQTSVGLFTVHKVKDKYYFEIPDSILGRDILVVNRIIKAPVSASKSMTGYAGDEINENVIRFELGADKKVFMRSVSYLEQSNDTTGMYQSVRNSNIMPILSSFPIACYKTDTAKKINQAVFEVTAFLNGDNQVFTFDTRQKKMSGIGSIFADRAYIDTIKAFPLNIEIKTVKTFAQIAPEGFPAQWAWTYPNDPLTFELNNSLVLLPKEPMKARFFDPRVGYFAASYIDFDINPQGVERKSKITRWRLEPKPEDLEKYLAGELVEPQKPIVIYIDPATPKKWVPYLILGVNDWQVAFEQAGFKNAIYALEAPNDSTWSLEDARHSAVIYKASNIANASGPHVHDPRSGEIIETHINWYHNVMKLLHDWYLIQAGTIDERARKMQIDDDLMGQLIRFVSSHEVGHTLGLRHNWGSSSTVPTENLRNKAWVEANGHTPSIMDYARFNYVAQPEDNITENGIFPRIGIYDKWAIEWGYKYLPQFNSPEEEIAYQNKLISEKLLSDKRYFFGTESDRDDPRNQNEDLGDNAIQSSTYGIKNLQRIVPEILAWTKEPNKNYSSAANIYEEVANQFLRYSSHVAKNVGGIYTTQLTVEQAGNSKEFVSKNQQKEALKFLNEQVFATPTWLINKELIEKAGVEPITIIGNLQKSVINRLISKNTLEKLLRDETYNGANAYTTADLFADLKKGVWADLLSGAQVDIYRRNLQKNYVLALINIITVQQGVPVAASDATGIARVQLIELQQDIKRLLPASSGIKKSHLVDLQAQIEAALDVKK